MKRIEKDAKIRILNNLKNVNSSAIFPSPGVETLK